MAIDVLCWEKLMKHRGEGKTLVSLGYPELLVPEAKLFEALGALPAEDEQATKQAPWHGWVGILRNADEALRALGYMPTYLDYYRFRHVEEVVDLNQRLAYRPFDVVCDFGTTEHIFNVGQAFENLLMLSKKGTVVLQSNPMNRPNHGFWSFSPTAYADFWEANGGHIEDLLVYDLINKGKGPTAYDAVRPSLLERTQRVKHTNEANIFCEVILTKTPDVYAKWPIQTKYREKVKVC